MTHCLKSCEIYPANNTDLKKTVKQINKTTNMQNHQDSREFYGLLQKSLSTDKRKEKIIYFNQHLAEDNDFHHIHTKLYKILL